MKKEKSKAILAEVTGQKDRDRKAAWVAVRCATAVGQAIRSRILLTGEMYITTLYNDLFIEKIAIRNLLLNSYIFSRTNHNMHSLTDCG